MGIRLKLALGLFLVVGGALAAAYAIVVPQLENRLVAAKLSSMEREAVGVAVGLPADPFSWDLYAETASVATGARVAVFSVLSNSPTTLATIGDSRADASTDVADDPVALLAASSKSVTRGRVERGGREYAEVAAPALPDRVILLSTSLADQLATVELVQRRLFEAAVVALALAAISGTLAAGMHARRIRRLERAANRIAAGSFDEPVVDRSSDELGQLAMAFDRMRVQLAQLDTARKEFVANASHELRTPLFSLSGFLELLADEDLDEPTRIASWRPCASRSIAWRSSRPICSTCRASMPAGSASNGKTSISPTRAGRSPTSCMGWRSRAGTQLEVEVEGDVWALADEARVLQIGRALAGNALVHTPAGTQVTLRARRDGGRRCSTWPTTAPASPPTTRTHLRPFYRIEGGLASGSGLGLAIARELVERMGGELDVRSLPGSTVFSASLPPPPLRERATRSSRAKARCDEGAAAKRKPAGRWCTG